MDEECYLITEEGDIVHVANLQFWAWVFTPAFMLSRLKGLYG